MALKLQERFYPLPNFGPDDRLVSQNYRTVRLQQVGKNPTAVYRFDHRFTETAFANVRLTRTDWTNPQYSGSLPTIPIQAKGERHSRTSTAAFTYTIRPALLSESRWGFASDNIPVAGPINGKALAQELGLRGLAEDLPDLSGLFNVGFSGLGLTGISGAGYCEPCANHYRHSFLENISWFRGRHSIKMGFQTSRGGYKDYRPGAALFGSHNYSNRFTGFPYADFLLGIPTTASREHSPLLQDIHGWEYGGFFTDEFKVRPSVTITYGVRYEVRPGYISAGGRQAVFDIGTGMIVVPDGALNQISPLMPRGSADTVEAGQAGFASQTLIRADKNNFAPRFGVAWRPFGENTVFRGGYGIFYDMTARTPAFSGVPFRVNEPAFTNPAANPTVVLPLVFPLAGAAGPATVSIPGAVRKDLRIPYSMQYTATVEHQRWDMGFRLSYTGTNTRQGVWTYDYNQPLADARPYVSKARAFPRYPRISYASNGAGHQYHGMTVEALRRMKSGLHFQTFYTWARDIGDLENGESPENAYDRRRERAVWADIPTHRFNLNTIWEIPVGKGKSWMSSAGRVLNGILGGWRLGVIYTYDAGFFLTPLWTGPDPTGTRYSASTTPANVTLRPNHLRNANISDRTVQRWFDPGAFAPPSPGSFGTSAKGVIKGTPGNVWHGNLAKDFVIKERVVIRPEIVVNNLLNHPNYRDPGLNITQTAQVGVISNVSDRNYKLDGGVPRVAQLILRVEW